MFNKMQIFNSVVIPIANAYTVSMYYYAQRLHTHRILSYNNNNIYL